MNRMRAIQVGVGGFGKVWITKMKDVQSLQIVAIADIVQENLIGAQEILGDGSVPMFDSHERAFREVEADIALLITPPPTHYRLTRDALQAGMHVIMEKPVAPNYKEAFELQQMTKLYGKVVAVNQNYRWSPQMRAIKMALEAGLIGDVGVATWQFARNTMTSPESQADWRKDRDEPLLTELSIHHFDLMRYFFDRQPISVFAHSFNPSWSTHKGNTSASVILQFDEGVHVNYFASSVNRGRDTPWAGDFRLVGNVGALEYIDGVAYHVTAEGVRHPLAAPILQYDTVDYTVHEFIQAIRENRQPATHIDDNLVSFSIVGAAIESSYTGNVVRLDSGYYKPLH